jgi:hypothetical protein
MKDLPDLFFAILLFVIVYTIYAAGVRLWTRKLERKDADRR